jgi:septum formation protein
MVAGAENTNLLSVLQAKQHRKGLTTETRSHREDPLGLRSFAWEPGALELVNIPCLKDRIRQRSSMMKAPPLVLASASPRRAELLRQLVLEFRVIPSEAPELHHNDFTAPELAQVNAYRKARAVAKLNPDALVLGADTLVYLGELLLGKPGSLDHAAQMLHQLQGRSHHVVTAVCLLHLRQHRQQVLYDITTVTFRALNAAQIQDYLAKINPLDKAGAYAIQESGDDIVEKIDGSWSNVVGLPVEKLKAILAAG